MDFVTRRPQRNTFHLQSTRDTERYGLWGTLSNRYQERGEKPCKPCATTGFWFQKLIPTRYCSVCSKRFCLWDLALIIYIVSIIQIVWAI